MPSHLPSRRDLGRLLAATPALSALSSAAPKPLPNPRGPFHGAAWYPELWPEADIEQDLRHMHELGINVVRIAEFAWSKMEPDEGKINLDFFARLLDRLDSARIGVILCTPTATPPIWLTDNHPERCFVDQNRTVMVHGARQHASYDNPDVRKACFRIVEALAKSFGEHPALKGWQIDNEFKCHVAEDFNPSSIELWHHYLWKRYTTIDKLNDAWGAEIWSQRYQRFEQVPAPFATPFTHNPSLVSAWQTFSRENIAAFLAAQCDIIRKHSHAPITHNMHLQFATSLELMSAPLDFASYDAYPSAANYQTILLNNDLFRAAKPNTPFWVMETSAAHNGWLRDYQPAHPTGYLPAEAVASYAAGAEGFSYWLWRQQRTGAELPHSAILSPWQQPTIGYESVKAVGAALKQISPLLLATVPATPEAAITWSDRGRVFFNSEPLGTNATYHVDFVPTLAEWHKLLTDAGIPRDLRFENAALDGLKLLITPVMPAVSPEFLQRARTFVEAGGVWLCGPLTGYRTVEHTAPTDAALGALETLAGVETVFSFPLTGQNATGQLLDSAAPLSGWCHALKTTVPEAKPLGVIRGDLANGLAYATERKLGKGAIVLLGAQPQGDPGRFQLAKLLAHCATLSTLTQRYTATPGTLVFPRVNHQGKRLWFAVNLDGKGGRVEIPAEAKDALTGQSIPAGSLQLTKYQFRVFWF